MEVYKHCNRPESCWYLKINNEDIKKRPLKTIAMIKIFNGDKSINNSFRNWEYKEK